MVEQTPINQEEPKNNSIFWIIFFVFAILVVLCVGFFILREKISSNKITDCGTNWDCFIKASKDCSPASVSNTITTDIFGVKQKTTSYFEIKGVEEGKCIFYLQTEKIDLTFPKEVSEEIIDKQKEVYKKLEGRDGTCKFNTNDLTAMLNRWKVGTFSTKDWDVAECGGSYFSQQI